MSNKSNRFSLCALLSGLMLTACGPVPESSEVLEAPEVLGMVEAALDCSSSAVTGLTISGASTYQGEMAAAGTYAVSYPANAAWLTFYINGSVAYSVKKIGASGSWSFSKAPLGCGAYTFMVKAWPMVVSSTGDEAICSTNTSLTASKDASEPCPGTCAINGKSYSNGTVNPSSSCQICDVSRSQTSWSFYSGGYVNTSGYCKPLVNGGGVCSTTSMKAGQSCSVNTDCYLTCGEML